MTLARANLEVEAAKESKKPIETKYLCKEEYVAKNNTFVAIGKPLGNGSYKTAYETTSLKTTDDKRITQEFSSDQNLVIYRPFNQKDLAPILNKAEIQESVAKGCETIQQVKIQEDLDGEKFLTGDRYSTDFASLCEKPDAPTLLERVAIIKDTAKGVKHIHSKSYVHGDLKPDNILVKKDELGKYKGYLADFDIVYDCDDMNHIYNEYYGKSHRNGPAKNSDIVGLALSLGETVLGGNFFGLFTRRNWRILFINTDYTTYSQTLRLSVQDHIEKSLILEKGSLSEYRSLDDLKKCPELTASDKKDTLLQDIEIMEKSAALIRSTISKDLYRNELSIDYFIQELEAIKAS